MSILLPLVDLLQLYNRDEKRLMDIRFGITVTTMKGSTEKDWQ